MNKYINKISELPSRIGLTLSYIICINLIAFMMNSFRIIMWYIFNDSFQNIWLIKISNAIAYSMLFWCGCIAGHLIQKKSIFHSSLVVALGVMYTFLLSGVGPNDYILLLEGISTGAALGGIGGGCTLIVRKLRHSKSKK